MISLTKGLKVAVSTWLLCMLPPLLFAQSFFYSKHTGEERTAVYITKGREADLHTLELREEARYSRHFYSSPGFTQKWILRDDSLAHDFVAERKGEAIYIRGKFFGEAISKSVKIDQAPWINKIDHGLSAWAVSEHDELVFWVLKLKTDLDPMRFKAEKIGEEDISLPSGTFRAVKVKLTFNNFVLSHLWSAYCWYRKSDGLFLRYEGVNGGPGTPLTVIRLQPKEEG
jgi:hypothetical protein